MCSGLMESYWTPRHSRFKSSGKHSQDVVLPLTQFCIRVLVLRRKLAVFRGLKMPFKKLDEKEIARINQLQQERFDTLVDTFEPPLPAGVPERLARIVAAAKIEKGASVLDVGTGSGILISLIQQYEPGKIHACDISREMLKHVQTKYSGIVTHWCDVRDLTLPDNSLDVVFINACYGNIADKPGTFRLMERVVKPAGKVVISHPLGKDFIGKLKPNCPFPLDDFPGEAEARMLLGPFGFDIHLFLDEPELYLLVAMKRT